LGDGGIHIVKDHFKARQWEDMTTGKGRKVPDRFSTSNLDSTYKSKMFTGTNRTSPQKKVIRMRGDQAGTEKEKVGSRRGADTSPGKLGGGGVGGVGGGGLQKNSYCKERNGTNVGLGKETKGWISKKKTGEEGKNNQKLDDVPQTSMLVRGENGHEREGLGGRAIGNSRDKKQASEKIA